MKYSTFYSVFPILCLILAYQTFLSNILNPSKLIIFIFLIGIMVGWLYFWKNQRIIVFLATFSACVISFLPFIFNYTKDVFLLSTSYATSLLTLFILMVTKFSNQVTKL